MKSSWAVVALVFALPLQTGCGSDSGRDADVGSLSLTLQSTSGLGVEYRLVSGVFSLVGPEVVDVSSGDHPPDQPTLDLDLTAGDYQVSLQSGWEMTHRAPGQQDFTPIAATLVSDNPSQVTVSAGENTQVAFTFLVDEALIEFGPGTLSIGVGVQDNLPPERTVVAIAFIDGNEVKVATKDDGDWTVETVDRGSAPPRHVTIAFDSVGAPHLAYQDAANKILKHATREGATWVTEIVDSTPDSGGNAFLAIDSLDRMHIAYGNSGSAELLYALGQEGIWTVESVRAASAYSIGLFIDSSDVPHLSHLEGASATPTLHYSSKQGAWTTETVGTYTNPGFESRTSVVVDSASTPHIAIYDLAEGLHHVGRVAGLWVDKVIAPGTMATGQYPALGLTSEDRLVCGYVDFGSRSAKLVRQRDGGWTQETADAAFSGWVLGLSMTLDDNDVPYMSYYDADGSELRMASKVDGVWTVEVVAANSSGRETWIAQTVVR